MHVSQMLLQCNGTVLSQHTMTTTTLRSPIHPSPNLSFSTSSAPSPHAEHDTTAVMQLSQESTTALSMPRTIENGA